MEDKWVSAEDLCVGDILTIPDGSNVTITKVYVEKLNEPVIVYNFEVEDFHTYFITSTKILVHNANSNGNCGIVEFKAPPDATPEEIEQVKLYVDGCNEALKADIYQVQVEFQQKVNCDKRLHKQQDKRE